jgi:hypothetical protein
MGGMLTVTISFFAPLLPLPFPHDTSPRVATAANIIPKIDRRRMLFLFGLWFILYFFMCSKAAVAVQYFIDDAKYNFLMLMFIGFPNIDF